MLKKMYLNMVLATYRALVPEWIWSIEIMDMNTMQYTIIFENIGFNTVLTDPFMSQLATQLGYSAGEFQALQLIVLAAFGVVD